MNSENMSSNELNAEDRAAVGGVGFSEKLRGIFQRNSIILIPIVVAFAVGPFITDYITTYRAIVLETHENKMFLAWTNRPMQWKEIPPGFSASGGQLVVKKSGTRDLQIEQPSATDQDLVTLYQRYVTSYSGVVQKILSPRVPGGAYMAMIKTEEGQEINVPLYTQELARAAVGSTIQKRAKSWDPLVVDVAPTKRP